MAATEAVASGLHYVVLSDGLGKWKKGDVVSAIVLAEKGCDMGRLQSLHALRVASEFEATRSHVDLQSPEMHLSYEHLLAERDKQISRLQSRVAGLEEQISAGVHLSHHAGSDANVTHQATLIEQKDRALQSLDARLQQAEARAVQAEDTLRDLLQASQAAKVAAAKAPAAPAPAPAPAPAVPDVAEKQLKPAKPKVEVEFAPTPSAPPPPAGEDRTGASRIRRVG